MGFITHGGVEREVDYLYHMAYPHEGTGDAPTWGCPHLGMPPLGDDDS